MFLFFVVLSASQPADTLERARADLAALLEQRGILRNDLSKPLRARLEAVESGTDSDVDSIRELIGRIRIDNYFVQAKMQRLNVKWAHLLKKKKPSPQQKGRVVELLSRTTEAFADAHYVRANAALNELSLLTEQVAQPTR